MSFLFKKNNLISITVFSLVFSIPFNIKKLIYSFSEHVSEFYSVFFYFTDIFLIFLIFLFIHKGDVKKELNTLFGRLIIIFVLLSFVSIFFAPEKLMAIYHALRLSLYSFSAIAISYFIKNKFVNSKLIYIALAVSAVFQSVIGFLQFLTGRSIGVGFLGESFMDASIKGVARVFVSGEHFLRAYGTMPHANILASFLILGLLSLFYLIISIDKNNKNIFWKKTFYSVLIFIIYLGLIVTFSRSGWITFFITGFFMFLYGIYTTRYRKNTLFLLFIFIFQSIFIFFVFSWAILPRASFTLSEPSVNHRVLYNDIGIDIISNNVMGVGIGNEVSFAIKKGLYIEKGFSRWWLWQPTHNLYLLIASEMGLQGIVIFIIFLYFLFFKKKKNDWDINFVTSLIILFSLLVFGLVDHFMWDIPTGELMMWLSIGLVLYSINKDNIKHELPQR